MSEQYTPEINDIVSVPGLPDNEAIIGMRNEEKGSFVLFYHGDEVGVVQMLAIAIEEAPQVLTFIKKVDLCEKCGMPEWVYMPAGFRCHDYFERTYRG